MIMPDTNCFVHSAKVFGARFSRFTETEVIQIEFHLLQRKGPKARLDDLWPSMLCVDQNLLVRHILVVENICYLSPVGFRFLRRFPARIRSIGLPN